MDLHVAPPPTPVSLAEHALTELRRLLVTGEIPPGTHLVEAALSRSMGVSRGPIREALTTLQQENLVETRKSGAFAVGLSLRDLDELYALRGLIELEALRLSSRRESPDWEPVRGHLERMAAAAAAGDTEQLAAADLDFHSAFYRIAGQRRLETVWKQYRPTFRVLLSLSNAEGSGRLTNTVADHRALFDAVQGGDQDDIARRFTMHNAESLRRMRGYVERLAEPSAVTG